MVASSATMRSERAATNAVGVTNPRQVTNLRRLADDEA
jgi:hypothetical protein